MSAADIHRSHYLKKWWCNDIQPNDIQHKDIQHDDIQHKDIQHDDIQLNDIQQNGFIFDTQHNGIKSIVYPNVMLNVIMLSVIILNVVAPNLKFSRPILILLEL